MNFIVLDLEATCWQGNLMDRRQEVIELAAYCVTGYQEWNGNFHRYVKPVRHPRLSTYCMELTGITQQKVDRARSFETVFNDFEEWIEGLGDPLLLCTWGAKDMTILEDECASLDMDCSFLPKAINLKAQYASLHQLKKEVGLLKALEYSGIEFEGNHHSAKDDALNTAKLFLKYLDQWVY